MHTFSVIEYLHVFENILLHFFHCSIGYTIIGLVGLVVIFYILISIPIKYACLIKTVYRLDPEGLYVKYPGRRNWKLYSWDLFMEVSVKSAGPASEYNPGQNICLFFALAGHLKQPLVGNARTNNPSYYKKAFSLEYSESAHKKLKAYCPYKVPDRRCYYD